MSCLCNCLKLTVADRPGLTALQTYYHRERGHVHPGLFGVAEEEENSLWHSVTKSPGNDGKSSVIIQATHYKPSDKYHSFPLLLLLHVAGKYVSR